MRRLRQHFVAGLVVLLPFLISLLLVENLIAWAANLTSFLALFLFGRHVQWPGLWGLLIALAIITGVGVVANHYAGRTLLRWFESALRRVPVWRGLYDGVKQVLGTIVDRSGRGFQRVVLLPGPTEAGRVIGLVVSEADDHGRVSVFVPLSPPTGGMVVLYPEHLLESAGMSVEEAIRVLLSAGTLNARARTANDPVASPPGGDAR
jgi:uncharacterized membrane protein